MNCLVVLCALVILLGYSTAYKILLLFHPPGKSHNILGDGFVQSLLEAGHEGGHEVIMYLLFHPPGKSYNILVDGFVQSLLEAGHEVTYVTPYLGKHKHPNYTEIDLSRNVEVMAFSNIVNIGKIINAELDPGSYIALTGMTLILTDLTLSNENFQKLMMDPNVKFDAVIVEWFYSDIFVGLGAVFDCPLIWFLSTEPAGIQLSLIDEFVNPAYSPDPFSTAVPPFNFKNRVLELWYLVFGQTYKYFYVTPKETIQYEKYYGPAVRSKKRSLPPYESTRYNSPMMLGNSHVSLGSSIRLPQNYKPIGGYHVNPDVKPLPSDLQELMDNAKNGVIYFSMGTNLNSKDMPEELKRSLVKMFGELKYTVIWKLEENLADTPPNLHIMKWAPQPSILSHPKCVLFITHGGQLSTTETVHFGVPIIGIPTYADQFVNVVRAVSKGYARKVNLSRSMAADLKDNIAEILSNPSYTLKAKELSAIYHDRPVPPRAELVHWVEHVVRTRGAPHLRSPALDVPLYQKLYLDLLGVIIAALIVLRAASKRLIKSITTSKKVYSANGKKHN